jgi:hypothetical protein
MTQGSGMPDDFIGALSPDGDFYWDGAQWKPVISPDPEWKRRRFVWLLTLRSSSALRPLVPFTSARTLGICVSVLLGISIAVALVELLVVDPYYFVALTFGGWEVDYDAGIAGVAMLALTSALFLVWFRRPYRNLAALGAQELEFTPGWAVGWWFVPVACWWMPYRATHEMWKASDPRAALTTSVQSRCQIGASAVIRLWWAAWIASVLLFNCAAFVVKPDAGQPWLSALSAAATALAAILSILVVRSISARQVDRSRQLTSAVPAGVAASSQSVQL